MERTDHTLNKLRQMIASGDFNGGGRIPPERSLASELGVGRRSLRRALEVLEQEGQISRHQGRGTFINGGNGHGNSQAAERGNGTAARANGGGLQADGTLRADPAFAHILDHTNPLEVIEVRLAIEPVLARLAAFRASQAEINRLTAMADETRAAPDPATYEVADLRFHRTIAEVARNTLFLAVFDTLNANRGDAAWRRLSENAHCFKRQSVYADNHQEIALAIAARQGEKAQDLMQRHLSDVQRYIYEHAFPGAAAKEQ
ncbi:MAG TPA: FCD domain-containing protein [Candidatus Binatia bacterium]|nr:FCD domain-containing protein [Candidatus Binatia bacterium]